MKQKRIDTTTTASPWRLRNIFKGRQDHADGSAFFSRELDTKKDEQPICKLSWSAINSTGYKFTRHPGDQLLAKKIFTPEFIAGFGDELTFPTIDALCFYRMSEQDDTRKDNSGVAYKITENDEASYLIGIAVEVLECGAAYTAAILAHELAHVAVDRAGGDIASHGPEFAKEAQRLAEQYEAKTGRSIPYDVTGPTIS